IGEGGSGGALALACANRVYMLENSVYSVISPEGCASIIWKDSQKVTEAAECLHITADDMVNFGVAEGIFPEDFSHFKKMCANIRKKLCADVDELTAIPGNKLIQDRYNRFRKLGNFVEE
ncbi:MAG: acetyl-CoA carboxylase carboxyl transferase subunit alpha, partial [Acutalibacteraceae bacterium]|nr:acetyl-CoA carboxylase carboxyl transferase subunit alpha [Acutalibacteraceae bacterium]